MKDFILILALAFILYLLVMLIIDAIKNLRDIIKDFVKYCKWKKNALATLRRQKELQRMADEEIAKSESEKIMYE